MRPLYIEGVAGCRVVLDEPALRIVVPEQSDRLFPLSRISKVVCSGIVDWSMSAMLACADAGIMLLFLHKNGEIRAQWLCQEGVRQSLTQRVLDLFARQDGFSRYENWYLAMEKLAVRSFARRIGRTDWREIPVAYQLKQLAKVMSPAMQHRANVLKALLHGELVIWFKDCGFDAHDEVLVNGPVDFVGDLSKLLLWDCYECLLSESVATETPPLPAMATLFQQREDRLHLLFRSIINKFYQFLYTIH